MPSRSLAINVEAYNDVFRAAKSIEDFNSLETSVSASASAAIPNSSKNRLPVQSATPKPKPEIKTTFSDSNSGQRKHFNERPWIELEKFWMTRLRTPAPDLEDFIASSKGKPKIKTQSSIE